MKSEFIKFVELKTTEGQSLWIKPDALSAIEEGVTSQRVEGNVKIYIDGFKFLIAENKDQILKKVEDALSQGEK